MSKMSQLGPIISLTIYFLNFEKFEHLLHSCPSPQDAGTVHFSLTEAWVTELMTSRRIL